MPRSRPVPGQRGRRRSSPARAFISFLVDRLALNHVFTSPPFLAFAAGAVFRLTSLSLVPVESPGYGGRTATLGPVMHL